jgi:molybdopterin-containing oxidoreductase family membrane subunit
MRYLLEGLEGHNNLVPWIWTAMSFNVIGFLLFLIPGTRKRFLTLNVGCALIFAGIWIEKGMGLIVPGFIPDALGEIYEYMPSSKEVMIAGGIWGTGAMVYTLLVRIAIAIDTGRLRHPGAPPASQEEEEGPVARDIMSKDTITVGMDSTAEDIGITLVTNRISGVPVVDGENRVAGVVSESDIIFSEIHREPHLAERLADIIIPEAKRKRERPGLTALEIMTSPAITAREEAPMRELIQTITDKKIKRIIIVDADNRPVGIVSRIDIVRVLENVQLS